MIESRYKIEYILPDEDLKKSSPFKVLWYLLLIPLVLLAVIAITYDFSLNNIARDSSVLVEKAKIHIFNLGDNRQRPKPFNQTNQIVEKILIPKLKPVAATEQKTVSQKPLINNKKDDKIISELTAKQEKQFKKIQEQISRNKKLTQSLNSLSSELVIEKTRNDSLNSRLSEQEKDRLELEEQLNKILAESENNEVTLEDFVKKENTNAIIESKDTVIVKTKETVNTIKEKTAVKKEILVETKETVNTIKEENNVEKLETQKTELSKVDQIKPEKEEAISATDKIIQAMTSLKTNTVEKSIESNTSKLSADTTIDLDKESSSNTPEKIIPKSNDVLFAIGVEDKAEDKIVETLIPAVSPETQTENTTKQPPSEDISIKTSSTEEDKKEIVDAVIEVKTEPELEPKIKNPKPSSAVDAIIAAMQASQPKPPNNSNNSAQSIDLELEKEIKQQLVEQGDLSVDN